MKTTRQINSHHAIAAGIIAWNSVIEIERSKKLTLIRSYAGPSLAFISISKKKHTNFAWHGASWKVTGERSIKNCSPLWQSLLHSCYYSIVTMQWRWQWQCTSADDWLHGSHSHLILHFMPMRMQCSSLCRARAHKVPYHHHAASIAFFSNSAASNLVLLYNNIIFIRIKKSIKSRDARR